MNARTSWGSLRAFSPATSVLSRVSLTLILPVLALLINEWLRPQLEPTFEPAFTASVALVCWFCGPFFAVAALLLASALLVGSFFPTDGVFLFYDVNSALKFSFFVGANGVVIALIANLYRAQAERARSESMYRNLSELIPFGGWISDSAGNMQHVSVSFLNRFGVTLEQCQGLGWTNLIDNDQREQIVAEWKNCVRNGYFWDYEYRMTARNGETVYVLSRGVPVSDPLGKTLSWIGMHLDITERELSIDEQFRQARDIARFNAELEQLAYVSAHDLQEPLRTIASYLQLLQKRYGGQLDSDADDFINYAVEGANRLRELLGDLQLLQSIGKSSRPRTSHNLGQIVNRAVAELGLKPEEADIRCESLPEVVCDGQEFLQLFEHLLGNAVKYSASGVHPIVRVSAERTDEGYTVCVRDNGIGIASEYHPRIFDVFQRLHPRSRYPGTGIGLAICRKIVEVHGGRIWVESVPGNGSAFYFTVPDTQ